MSHFNFHTEISQNVQKIWKVFQTKVVGFEKDIKEDRKFKNGWRRQGHFEICKWNSLMFIAHYYSFS